MSDDDKPITWPLLTPTAESWRQLGVEPSEELLAGSTRAILEATHGLLAPGDSEEGSES